MPQSRSADSPAPKNPAARPKKTGGKSVTPRLNPNDAGVKRRAAQRAKRRRSNTLAWGFLAIATVVLSGAFGVMSGATGIWSGAAGIWTEYQSVQDKISLKQATLDDLRAQLERKQRRVEALDKREGKERALVEGGYLGEGERFLLFPKGKEKPKDD